MMREFLQNNPLKPLLVPGHRRVSYPKACERAQWHALSEPQKREILLAAEAYGQQPYPLLTATQFLAFTRDGSRKVFEDPYFFRRKKLIAAALHQCLTLDGSQLDQIIDGLWCICEESTWVLSAHNVSSHPGALKAEEKPLPDTKSPYIDLFAAQTAATLALVCYLLEDSLNAVTPLLIRRVAAEIEARILAPFLNHDDFWWMGMMPKTVNNWTPWILSNVILTLLIFEKDDYKLCEGLERALKMLDSYLAIMPPDGGCDEGVAYWNMAGGALLDCLEAVAFATDGKASFYHEPLIQAIGAFPLAAHIHGDYFLNFADCDAKPILDGERIYTFGLRTGQLALKALGAAISASNAQLFPKDTPEFSRMLDRLFHPVPPAPFPEKQNVILPDLQVYLKRSGGLVAAIKGGHNGENHNHNDVGSFILYAKGQPQVIDVGNMVYTAKTFGPDRYTLFNTRSMNHNLPLIGGFEQQQGEEKRALNVLFTEGCAQMELKACYPPEAGIQSFNRSLTSQPKGFCIRDEILLDEPLPVTWVMMLRERPEIHEGLLKTGSIEMAFDPGLVSGVEAIDITDERMARNFPGTVYRATFTAGCKARHQQGFAFNGV